MEDDEHRDLKHYSWPTSVAMNEHHAQHNLVNVQHHKHPSPLYPHEHSKLRRFSQRFSTSSSSYASYSSALAAAATATTSIASVTSTAHPQRSSQHYQHNYQQLQHHPSEDPYDFRTRSYISGQQRKSLATPEAGTGVAVVPGASAETIYHHHNHHHQQSHLHYQRHSAPNAPPTTTSIIAKSVQSGLPPAISAQGGSTPPSPLSSPLAICMPASSSCSCPSPSAFSPLSPSSPTMGPTPTLSMALPSSCSSSSSSSTAMALCSPVMTVVSTLSQDSSPDSSASSRCSSRTSSASPPPGRSRKVSLGLLSSQLHHHSHQYEHQEDKHTLKPCSGSRVELKPMLSLPSGEELNVPFTPTVSIPPTGHKKNRRGGGLGHAQASSISTTRSSTSFRSSTSDRQHHRLSTATTATSLSYSSLSSVSSTTKRGTGLSASVSSQEAQTTQSLKRRRKRQHRHTQHSSLQQTSISPQAIAQNSTKYIRFLFWPLLPLLILAIGGQTSAWFESPEKSSHSSQMRQGTEFMGHVRARKPLPASLLEAHPHYNRIQFEPIGYARPSEDWFVGKQLASTHSSLMTTRPAFANDRSQHSPHLPSHLQCQRDLWRSWEECIIQEQPRQPKVQALEGEVTIVTNAGLEQQAHVKPLLELHQPWDRESCGCAISGTHLLSLLSWDMLKPEYSWRQRSSTVGCRDGLRHDAEGDTSNTVSASSLLTAWADMVDQVLGSLYKVSQRASWHGPVSQTETTSGVQWKMRNRWSSSNTPSVAAGAAASNAAQHERQSLGRYLFRIAFVLGLVLLCMAIHETFFAQVDIPSYARA